MIDLLLVAALVGGYGLASGRLEGSPVTAPMVFVGAGLLIGSDGLGWFTGATDAEAIRVLAEATLVLVLFTDAVRIDLVKLRDEFTFPLRLLGLGIPLGIAFGALAAVALPGTVMGGIGWPEALLLAAILVPTDAALGAAVVSDSRLPVRIRQSLNVESGLNDGIALPIVTLLVALAAAEQGGIGSAGYWAEFAAEQVGYGVLIGVAAGVGGGSAIRWADNHDWMTATYERLATLSVAVLAFAGAGQISGNGFIAAFVGGLAFGAVARNQCPHVHEFAEREGELLTVVTFLVFGAAIVGPSLGDVDWPIVFYAVLSLLVVRPLAVAVAMLGSRVSAETTLFLGWFGPRGLASILFALLVVEESGIDHGADIMLIASITVLISVFAHGLTAAPWTTAYARRANRMATTAPERVDMPEHHPRRRVRR